MKGAQYFGYRLQFELINAIQPLDSIFFTVVRNAITDDS
jgi:hypothetical protein